jgi:hypothetical protein
MRRLNTLTILPFTLMLGACSSLPPYTPVPLVTQTPPGIPTDVPMTATLAGESQQSEQPGASPTPEFIEANPDSPGITFKRLTGPGCCVQPFWSADGQYVRFIDQPAPTMPTGIYEVSIEGSSNVRLYSEQIGLPSPDDRYLAFLNESGDTVVQEVSSEAQSVIPNDGLRVFFSPGSARLAWADLADSGNFDQRPAVIGISDIDGANTQELITVYGGGIVGWLNDDTLLLIGRDSPGEPDESLFTLSVIDGARRDLVSEERIYTSNIAPGGEWVVYTIAFDPDSSENDGLWVVSTDGEARYKLDVVGSARWRDASRLLIIPIEMDAVSHRLWQFDSESGTVEPLTEPDQHPFRVASGDWNVSPTGRYVVFLNAEDESLWLIDLGKGQSPSLRD